jgi:hypothetical protein
MVVDRKERLDEEASDFALQYKYEVTYTSATFIPDFITFRAAFLQTKHTHGQTRSELYMFILFIHHK